MEKTRLMLDLGAALEIFFIICGFSVLIYSDAYYSPYLAAAAAGSVCLCLNRRQYFNKIKSIKPPQRIVPVIFSILFALMITMSNYNISSERLDKITGGGGYGRQDNLLSASDFCRSIFCVF